MIRRMSNSGRTLLIELMPILLVFSTALKAVEEENGNYVSFTALSPFQELGFDDAMNDLAVAKNFSLKSNFQARKGDVIIFFKGDRDQSMIIGISTNKDGKPADVGWAILDKNKMSIYSDVLKDDAESIRIRKEFDVYSSPISKSKMNEVDAELFVKSAKWISSNAWFGKKYGHVSSVDICIYVITDEGVSVLLQIPSESLLDSFTAATNEIMASGYGKDKPSHDDVKLSNGAVSGLKKHMSRKALEHLIENPGEYWRDARLGTSIGQTGEQFAKKCFESKSLGSVKAPG